MMEGEVSEPGAWMPEQVIGPAGFFSHLAKLGLAVQLAADSIPRGSCSTPATFPFEARVTS